MQVSGYHIVEFMLKPEELFVFFGFPIKNGYGCDDVALDFLEFIVLCQIHSDCLSHDFGASCASILAKNGVQFIQQFAG